MSLEKRSPTKPQQNIETFDNPAPQNSYWINMHCPEFTCLCPLTGQPDFAEIHVQYVPDLKCIELKSLKLYLWSFRDRGAFHEAITNEIGDHFYEALKPRCLRVKGEFKVRGGITTDVIYIKGNPADYPQ